ncbi:unnamed protein product [Closterium sp. Naga37s-1]|nr:unnamed protein product [Closterium sp. Naga37s-1]
MIQTQATLAWRMRKKVGKGRSAGKRGPACAAYPPVLLCFSPPSAPTSHLRSAHPSFPLLSPFPPIPLPFHRPLIIPHFPHLLCPFMSVLTIPHPPSLPSAFPHSPLICPHPFTPRAHPPSIPLARQPTHPTPLLLPLRLHALLVPPHLSFHPHSPLICPHPFTPHAHLSCVTNSPPPPPPPFSPPSTLA